MPVFDKIKMAESAKSVKEVGVLKQLSSLKC